MVNIREEIERKEERSLSPYAALSVKSKGRMQEEPEDLLRPVFQRDRDRIIHSKAFRRLKDKTQVFLTPEGDHYRTRLTHTLEVAQIARTVSRSLDLNEDLTEAIALAHDLGHTPFGHAGERAINRVCPLGFQHAEQSVRVVQLLERDGRGLNLTSEVLDGIRNHGMRMKPETLEGQVVRLSDKIAYMHHDLDDAVRAGILPDDRVPEHIARVAGNTLGERLDTFITDMIRESYGTGEVRLSEPVFSALMDLRQWMFENVYTNKIAKSQEGKAEKLIETLYAFFTENPEEMPEEYIYLIEEKGEKKERIVSDYISSMTDRYAIGLYEDMYIPYPWKLK